jgi:arylsulfatase A-like enzyme
MSTPDLVGLNDPQRAAAITAADRRHLADLYDAEIAYLDGHLGELFETLEEHGLADSTLVAVVGDHGQALGEREFFGHGLRLLEPVVRVPLVLRVPGAAPRRVTAPVETLDLLPTLADFFALPAPGELPGRSLRPVIEGRLIAPPRFRVVERRAYEQRPEVVGVSLHGSDWKAVYYFDEDGTETRRLGRGDDLDGSDHYDPASPEARWLEAVVAALRRDGGADLELDPEAERMLRALGYLD